MTKANDNEIRLTELLLNLWDGRWVLASVLGAALALGAAYVIFMGSARDTFSASIIIRPINVASAHEFRALNEVLTEELASNRSTSNEPAITRPRIMFSAPIALSEFVEVLLERNTIEQAARASGVINQANTGDDIPSEAALRSYAFAIDIKPVEVPSPTIVGQESHVTAWQVTWTANDVEKSREFITTALNLTNETARQQLLQRMLDEADFLRRENSRNAARLEAQIENAVQDYQFYLNDQLLYLSEQAALARILQIELEPNSETEINEFGGVMTYRSGYRALEEQIAILSSREQVDAFVPGLRDLQSQLRTVNQETKADELVQAIEETPLSDREAFRAAYYDIGAIKRTYPSSKDMFVLLLSLLAGGFFGIVSVMLRNALKERRSFE